MTLTIPLAAILPDALPRDRSHIDEAALAELMTSITLHGLRQPIEVFACDAGYGLISGLRRLTAFQRLHAGTNPHYASIEATLRTPTTRAEAMTLMVEENDIRAPLSPWEQGRIALTAVEADIFPTIDAAIKSLFPAAPRQKRARLRACASVVEELEGLLTTPERLTENRLLRLAAALRGTFIEVICQIFKETRYQSLDSQWSALLQTLIEADRGDEDFPATPTTPARPRRMLTLPQGLIIRRELSAGGYLLRFSGPEAKKGGLMDDVMNEVERLFRPE